LNNISARCPLKNNPGQIIHLDSNLAGVNYNIITNVMWYFDDVNKKNGTTILVPGSHKIKNYADENKKIKNKVYINAKKGSLLIFNANLWHGGSSKKNNKSRWALVLGYARWFIKPSFDYMKNTPMKIYSKLTKEQKALLGFDLIPPRDEFTRMTRRSNFFEKPSKY
jgi:ectoine hydroxylase-related dioxygenase (phytanoyl-CoA dioxygenase family)